MVEHVEFKESSGKKSDFQYKMEQDLKNIKSSQMLTIEADKTTNLYQISLLKYNKLLQDNVTSEYKVAEDKIVTDIIESEKKVASIVNLSDRMEIPAKVNARVTIKDSIFVNSNHALQRIFYINLYITWAIL